MAFIQPADVAAGDVAKASNQNAQNDALADLNSRTAVISDQGIANGSFEFDFDLDGEPDEWTISNFSGGTHALDPSSGDGAQSLKCVTTVAGGFVEAVSDIYIPILEHVMIEVPFSLKTSVATIRVRSQVIWYDAAQVILSTSTLYDSIANPTTNFEYIYGNDNVTQIASVSGAKYYRVKLIAGEVGNTVAGDVWFDFVKSRLFRGKINIVKVNLSPAISSNTTTLVSIDPVSGSGRASEALVSPSPGLNLGVDIDVQGWVEGGWVSYQVFSFGTTPPTLAISVPLNNNNQIRVVTTGVTSGSTNIQIYGYTV